jgi:hypothetical protein
MTTRRKGCAQRLPRRQALGAAQIEFISLVLDELTDDGVVEPRRFNESPYTVLDVLPGDVRGEVEPLDLAVGLRLAWAGPLVVIAEPVNRPGFCRGCGVSWVL